MQHALYKLHASARHTLYLGAGRPCSHADLIIKHQSRSDVHSKHLGQQISVRWILQMSDGLRPKPCLLPTLRPALTFCQHYRLHYLHRLSNCVRSFITELGGEDPGVLFLETPEGHVIGGEDGELVALATADSALQSWTAKASQHYLLRWTAAITGQLKRRTRSTREHSISKRGDSAEARCPSRKADLLCRADRSWCENRHWPSVKSARMEPWATCVPRVRM